MVFTNCCLLVVACGLLWVAYCFQLFGAVFLCLLRIACFCVFGVLSFVVAGCVFRVVCCVVC